MNCLICGKSIKSYKSTEGKQRYCSKECRLKKTHIYANCLWCGVIYRVAQSRYYQKGNRYKYCLDKCYNESIAALKKQRLAKITYICTNCAKIFTCRRNGKTNWRFCGQECSKQYMRGKEVSTYVNGTTINVAGYKLIKVGDKYLYEHRLVMEEFLGRKLKKDEVVHHRDENRLNNDISNLELLEKREHDRYHTTQRHRKGGF